MQPSAPPRPPLPTSGWQRFASTAVRAFHGYASWLVGISWWRFFLLSILLLIACGILSNVPPFSWTISETVSVVEPKPPKPPKAPAAAEPGAARIKIEKSPPGADDREVEISIGEGGIRIRRGSPPPSETAASAAADAASAAQAAEAAAQQARDAGAQIEIKLPPGPVSEAVREAIAEAQREIRDAVEEAARDAEQARRDAEEAMRDAEEVLRDAELAADDGPRTRISRVSVGEFLPQLAVLWIIASIVIKVTYKGRLQAEVKAAQATETAESESLKRQVVEARMAAMQAQVEPHFLFNTLASIDHLIETAPQRASTMQKNLIALLRASMPTMREADTNLGRELAVIKPYLEILKVRMEERLTTEIAVPDGLLSAEFPPMMLQSLVENAIKHGLEPKPEGGLLRVAAEIVHGQLVVTVADTGLGFGRAGTAGTGIGLANIRERLQLLYGQQASLSITENAPSGTRVTIALPYASKPVAGRAA